MNNPSSSSSSSSSSASSNIGMAQSVPFKQAQQANKQAQTQTAEPTKKTQNDSAKHRSTAGKKGKSSAGPTSSNASGKHTNILAPLSSDKQGHKHIGVGESVGGANYWTDGQKLDKKALSAFWMQLSDQQRREIAVIDKEMLLQKMKEQHKTACCHCAYCGRTRSALYNNYIYLL
jgi:hypothetical protein